MQVQDTQQNGLTEQLEPILAAQIPKLGYRRQRTSRKPQAVKNAVLLKVGMGLSKTQISEDLGISRPTVNSILNAADISQHVSELRSDMVLNGDLVKSVRVMRRKLNKGSESAATTILRGFNVLQSNPKVEINIANFGAQQYAQRMAQRQAEQENAPIEVKALESSESATISSVPATKQD